VKFEAKNFCIQQDTIFFLVKLRTWQVKNWIYLVDIIVYFIFYENLKVLWIWITIQALLYGRNSTFQTASENVILERKIYRTRHVWRRTNTDITLSSCCSLWWWWMDIETNGSTLIRYGYVRQCCSKPHAKVNNVHILSMTTLDILFISFR